MAHPTFLGSKHLKNLSYNEGKAVYLTGSLQQHIDDKRKKSLYDIKKELGTDSIPNVLGS